jgi:hypothetical protein
MAAVLGTPSLFPLHVLPTHHRSPPSYKFHICLHGLFRDTGVLSLLAELQFLFLLIGDIDCYFGKELCIVLRSQVDMRWILEVPGTS